MQPLQATWPQQGHILTEERHTRRPASAAVGSDGRLAQWSRREGCAAAAVALPPFLERAIPVAQNFRSGNICTCTTKVHNDTIRIPQMFKTTISVRQNFKRQYPYIKSSERQYLYVKTANDNIRTSKLQNGNICTRHPYYIYIAAYTTVASINFSLVVELVI